MRKLIAAMLLISLILTPTAECYAFETQARAYIYGDGEKYCVIGGENEQAPLPVAMLSRLMTMLVISQAFDSGELSEDTSITVSEYAASIKGPTAFVQKNEVIRASYLMKAAVMISAGDAICALKEALCPDSKLFASRLNEKADELGIETKFGEDFLANDAEFSAESVYKICIELLKTQSYTKYSGLYMDSIKHDNASDTELVNPNKLVKTMSGCIGLATGSSDAALYCGAYAIKRSEMTIVVVVLGAKNAKEREKLAAEIVESTFSTLKKTVLAKNGQVLVENAPVSGGLIKMVNLICLEDISVLMDKKIHAETEFKVENTELAAPLFMQNAAATATFFDSEGNVLANISLYPDRDVPKVSLWDVIKLFAMDFICDTA